MSYDRPARGVRINHIATDPDRFGRIHPVVLFSATPHHGHLIQEAHLNTIEDLKTRNYSVGDTVQLNTIGSHYTLGSIISPASVDERRPYTTEPTMCTSCHLYLVDRHGQPHCPEENCPRTVYARTLYATHPHVLDLPFGCETLRYLIWGRECITDFPSMFFLDAETISRNVHGDDEIEIILDALSRRLDQLFGRGYPPDVQAIAQYRFLDALSIDGLHRKNLKRLREGLQKKTWTWGELPHILTDPSTLRSMAITRTDIPTIVACANERIMELDCLSREF
jgi:NAD-dependent DNA ligase